MPLALQHNATLGRRLEADLADVEHRFNNELLSDLDCVNTLVGHIEQYRGKMLRPTLVLLVAAACQPEASRASQQHRTLATVVEMVHMATLVHDDILDDADIRRRGATINHLRGNEAAVMLGDYLISHAYHLCSSLNEPAISRAIAAATNTVCEGELLQLANRNNWRLDETTYIEIIRRKTASLCSTCCELSAMLSAADPAVRHALSCYGQKLGISFQIIDDVLDLTGEPHTVGKTLGRDLEKGKLTLPLIRYLAGADDAERRDMLGLLQTAGQPQGNNGQSTTETIRTRVVESGAIQEARGVASTLVEEARQRVLQDVPPSDARTKLVDVATALLARQA